jgi:hypothetical protein
MHVASEDALGGDVSFGLCLVATSLAGSYPFVVFFFLILFRVVRDGLLLFVLPAMMGMRAWYGAVRVLGQHVLDGQEPPPAKAVATIAAIMSLATSLLGTGVLFFTLLSIPWN